jgi:hypothetical protein
MEVIAFMADRGAQLGGGSGCCATQAVKYTRPCPPLPWYSTDKRAVDFSGGLCEYEIDLGNQVHFFVALTLQIILVTET